MSVNSAAFFLLLSDDYWKMNKPKKEKKFLLHPEYPGGRKALREFISAHLQYPEDALHQLIEGFVTVAYQVSDEGEIESVRIIKGLSPSCNEEAMRVVKLLKYSKVYNHGVRLKSNHKINIHFQMIPVKQKTMQISYTVKPSPQSNIPKKEKPVSPSKTGMGYTLVFHTDNKKTNKSN